MNGATSPVPGSSGGQQPTSVPFISLLLPRTVRGTLVFILLVVLVPLVFTEASIYYVRYQERKSQELEANLEVARGGAAALSAYVRDIVNTEYAIGQIFTGDSVLDTSQMNGILSANLDNYPSIRNLNWLAADGRAIASSRPDVIGIAYGDRDYVRRIQSGQDWIISDLMTARTDGAPVFTISRGVRDDSEKLIGVVVAVVDPDRLREVLKLPRSGQAAIGALDGAGRLVYRYPEVTWTPALRDTFVNDSTIPRARREGESISTTLFGIDNQTRWGSFVAVSGTDWVVGATRPETEVNARILGEIAHEGVVFSLITVLGSLAAIVVSRRLTGPLKLLEKQAGEIGTGTFTPRTDIGEPVELARLAQAINRMGADLKARELRLGQATAEAELRAAELSAVVENTQAQLALLDTGFRFLIVNAAYERGSGYTRAELVGRNHFQIFPHLENEVIFRQVRDSGEPYEAIERPFEFPDRPELGTTYWNWVLVPIKNGQGRTTELLLSLLDVTDQVRARKSIETAVKMRDDFISVAAHELKTPVTSIRGFAQLLVRQFEKTGLMDQARVIAAMKIMDEQTKRLAQLTDQMLNASSLQLGKLNLFMVETELSRTVEETVATVRQSYPDRKIEVTTTGSLWANADALRIGQVLINLLDNALKFSPPDSEVKVNVERDEAGWALIAVRDHGIGIPREQVDQIFERFYQAHPDQHLGGMGIGLYLSKQIVEMHGGWISVEQPGDGGSRFIVRLPVSSGQGAVQNS